MSELKRCWPKCFAHVNMLNKTMLIINAGSGDRARILDYIMIAICEFSRLEDLGGCCDPFLLLAIK